MWMMRLIFPSIFFWKLGHWIWSTSFCINCKELQVLPRQNPQTFAIWVSFAGKVLQNKKCRSHVPYLEISLKILSCQNSIWILWGKCLSKFLTVTNFENFTFSSGKILQNKCDRIWKVITLRVTTKRIHFSNKRSNSNFPDTFSSSRLLLWKIRHHPNTTHLMSTLYDTNNLKIQTIFAFSMRV